MVSVRIKKLRTEMTDAERKLWRALRSRRLSAKFRRQVPLGPYVVDFVCFETKVIVEVDGGQHATSTGDARRDTYFEQRGYRIHRFWNHEVLTNLEGVLTTLVGDPSPGAPKSGAPPSPSRGEGKTQCP